MLEMGGSPGGLSFIWGWPIDRAWTTLSYDPLDRLKTGADLEGNLVGYAYDEVGNLTSFTDARSKVTTYTYDDLTR
ncbi:MAG: hypothetical protein HY319_25625 [Armatimonadetes bacterium]|nr:hypothetical protein [Armatimonadota bacterium]